MNDVIIESLDTRSTQEWLTLSARTAHACTALSPCAVNEALESAAQSEPQSPLTPAYRLWMADNLAREGRHIEAIKGFDVAIRSAQSARRLLAAFDPLCCALRSKAQSATLADDAKLAIATYRELAQLTSEAPEALFQAGLIAEQHGSDDQAAELYSSAMSPRASTATDDPAELARRARLRLQDARTLYFPHHGALSDRLIQAIERKDIAQLGRLVSKTHFAIGVCGGHTRFEQPEMLEHLYRDLQSSTVTVREHVLGSGDKRYLLTHGWTGAWFVGDVSFLLTRAAKGWQWVGVALSHAHEPWLAHWSAATPEMIDATTEAQALPFGLLAPWPSGKRFMAGGQTDYAVKQALVLATPFPANLALAEAFALESCGFGPRGFYYKAVASHVDEDEFAIDFTKYRIGVPYDNDSGGTPVLATRAGIVVTANDGTPTGSTSASNTVAIVHPDPNNPSATDRFLTRYLHMEGPNKLTVSGGMTVLAGQRLGRMDDTGNSVFNHLHFSIHDKTLPHAKVAYGRSVRPTPMSGATLGDGDSGRCVLSNNVEQVPAVPGVHFEPASLSFGSTVVGDERIVSLTIKNTLGRSVTVSFPASTTPPFTWAVFNQTIPDGQTRTHAFQFRPTSEGNASKTLSITSNAPGSPHALQMAGTGRGGLIP